MNSKYEVTISVVIVIIALFSVGFILSILGKNYYSTEIIIDVNDTTTYTGSAVVLLPKNESTIFLNEEEIDQVFNKETELRHVFVNTINEVKKGISYKDGFRLSDDTDIIIILRDTQKNYYVSIFSDLPTLQGGVTDTKIFQITNTNIPIEIETVSVKIWRGR